MGAEQKGGAPGVTPEKAWAKIVTPERQAQIVKGVVGLAISLGLSPKEAGDLFSSLDDKTADGVAYMLSGVGDGQIVNLVGKKLKQTVKQNARRSRAKIVRKR